MTSVPTAGSGAAHDRAPRYRPDIDGLRAVAILPVVGFHAGLSWLGGGYVGVDVFFVISGYLITGIIAADARIGRFSVAQFYKRRIVRILPSLATVMIATSIVAVLHFFPRDLADYGRSVAAAALFASNLYFYATTDYFGGPAEEKPMLHTWSLAIEEQYYILFPLLLIALFRGGARRPLHGTMLVTALSFAVAIVGSYKAPTANFFLLPARACELGIGAIAALGGFPTIADRRLRNLLTAGGLAMILLGIVRFSATTRFPGLYAILPCGGAALLIVYGERTLAGRLLAWRPLVGAGLISYPLYLWHWPIIVFARLQFGLPEDLAWYAAIFGLSVLLATLSTFAMERPLLPALRRLPARTINFGGMVMLAGLAIMGAALAWTAPTLHHYPAAVAHVLRYEGYVDSAENSYQFRSGTCFNDERNPVDAYDRASCLAMDPAKRNYLVIGDSHAAHLSRALSLRFADRNWMQTTAAGCPPLDIKVGDDRCNIVHDVMLELLDGRLLPDKIILSARWKARDVGDAVRTATRLKARGFEVVVLGPTVEYRGWMPDLIARSLLDHDPGIVTRAEVTERRGVDRDMARRMAAAGIAYVSVYDIVCPGGRCATMATPDSPMQSDYGHFTLAGSKRVVAAFPAL